MHDNFSDLHQKAETAPPQLALTINLSKLKISALVKNSMLKVMHLHVEATCSVIDLPTTVHNDGQLSGNIESSLN